MLVSFLPITDKGKTAKLQTKAPTSDFYFLSDWSIVLDVIEQQFQVVSSEY